jgi:hypothetical protein
MRRRGGPGFGGPGRRTRARLSNARFPVSGLNTGYHWRPFSFVRFRLWASRAAYRALRSCSRTWPCWMALNIPTSRSLETIRRNARHNTFHHSIQSVRACSGVQQPTVPPNLQRPRSTNTAELMRHLQRRELPLLLRSRTARGSRPSKAAICITSIRKAAQVLSSDVLDRDAMRRLNQEEKVGIQL